MASEAARALAAQAWCKPTTQHLVMEPALAEAFAGILEQGLKDSLLKNPPPGYQSVPAVTERFITDSEGNPNGGVSHSLGLAIIWQQGPLVDPQSGERLPQTGCFVETVIQAAIGRLQYYQSTKFACQENHDAIRDLRDGLRHLQDRSKRRADAGVEGTHKPDKLVP